MKLADIKLNPDNPRNISEDKLDKLANSIRDFPKMMVQRPIVVKDGIIIGGNMRYRAIEKLGMTEIPDEWVSSADNYTEEERHRFVIQDNTEMGEHDWDLVANQYELEDLEAWGVELPISLQTEDEVQEDEAPEIDEGEAVSTLGTIYQLGRHRVMCGDSTDKTSVELLMDGVKADMVFTDPPYGVKYVGGLNDKKRDMIEGDDLELYSGFIPLLTNICKSSAPIYIWFTERTGKPVFEAVEGNGYKVRAMIVWNKQNAHYGNFMAQYMQKHEPCLYIVKDSPKWYGATNETTVWDIEQPSKNEHHPTQKPVALPARAIGNSSKTDDIILDLFLGSGSTLIACEQTDRTCYGMELDPKYVDVIRKRYAKFVNNNELPDNWEELTPKVSEESAENG